jgi:hypothetical protein
MIPRASSFLFFLSPALLFQGCLRYEPAPIQEVIPPSNEIRMLSEANESKWAQADISSGGDFYINEGILSLELGGYLSGAVWKGELPERVHYEVELEARKTFGNDFFMGLTLPVKDSHCSWICGGWGGRVVGISNIDGLNASENETTTAYEFEPERWYHFRIRVLPDKIKCWIDGEIVIDADIREREISMYYGDIEETVPFGLASYDTRAEYRNLVWRNLSP